MEKKIITYQEIIKYANNINIDNPPAILLSKFQSYLYKKLMQSKLKPLPKLQPLRGLALIIDMIFYNFLLIFIVLFAKNLLFIGYFHRVDEGSLKLLQYEDYDGKVLLRFRSHSQN